MVLNNGEFKGVVHGKTIELESESGLPDGLEVRVILRPASQPGDGIRSSFGGWADDAAEVDRFLEEVRRDRHSGDRQEPTL